MRGHAFTKTAGGKTWRVARPVNQVKDKKMLKFDGDHKKPIYTARMDRGDQGENKSAS